MPKGCYTRQPVPIEVRFWCHVQKTDTCWLWTGSLNEKGYGKLAVGSGRSPVRVHRLSWEMCNGPVPEGMKVLHTCDVRNCVNPSHLFLGTSFDNTQDMVQKGRGKFRQRAKFTDDQIREVFEMSLTRTVSEIAAWYGVSWATVHGILTRRYYRTVEGV